MKMLLRMARAVVESVLQMISQQLNVINMLLDMIKGSFLTQIAMGWRGDDAVAFQQEVTTKLIPQFIAMITGVSTMSSNIQKAADIITQADQKARSMVNNLTQLFEQIL